eukprot:tig00021468_g21644.t1
MSAARRASALALRVVIASFTIAVLAAATPPANPDAFEKGGSAFCAGKHETTPSSAAGTEGTGTGADFRDIYGMAYSSFDDYLYVAGYYSIFRVDSNCASTLVMGPKNDSMLGESWNDKPGLPAIGAAVPAISTTTPAVGFKNGKGSYNTGTIAVGSASSLFFLTQADGSNLIYAMGVLTLNSDPTANTVKVFYTYKADGNPVESSGDIDGYKYLPAPNALASHGGSVYWIGIPHIPSTKRSLLATAPQPALLSFSADGATNATVFTFPASAGMPSITNGYDEFPMGFAVEDVNTKPIFYVAFVNKTSSKMAIYKVDATGSSATGSIFAEINTDAKPQSAAVVKNAYGFWRLLVSVWKDGTAASSFIMSFDSTGAEVLEERIENVNGTEAVSGTTIYEHPGVGLTNLGVRDNAVFYAAWRGASDDKGADYVFAHRLNGTVYIPTPSPSPTPSATPSPSPSPSATPSPSALATPSPTPPTSSDAVPTPTTVPSTTDATPTPAATPSQQQPQTQPTPTPAPTPAAVPPLPFITKNQSIEVVVGKFKFKPSDFKEEKDKDGKTVFKVQLPEAAITAPQTGSGANEFIVVPVTGVLEVGTKVDVFIMSADGTTRRPATQESVEAQGSDVVLKFKAPQLRRSILQFAANTAYDLRIEPATGAPAFVPIVIGGAFKWTPVGTSASVPYWPNAAASTYTSSLLSSVLCGLATVVAALALHAAN